MKTLLTILLTISLTCQGQDLKYASINILSSSLIAGVGSGIHKHKDETFGHAFLNGVWKGAIGGTLNVMSKELLSYQASKEKLDWKLCWSAKIVNSFSNTIYKNAVLNESIIKDYSINIGFLRLSTNYKVQVDPISAGCFAGIIIAGGEFNIKKSLIIGTPIFYKEMGKMQYKTLYGNLAVKSKHLGLTYGQNILIEKDTKIQLFNEYGDRLLFDRPTIELKVIIHEIIHTYQRNQYMPVNNLFKLFNKYQDYKFIHNDLSSFDILYLGQNLIFNKKNNFFESEADFFSKIDNITPRFLQPE